MPYILKSDESLGCIFIKWRGKFSFEEGSAFFREIAQSPEYEQGAHLFHDVRQVDTDVPSSEIRNVAEAGKANINPDGLRKVAILTGSEESFGAMRMLATIREHPGLVFNVLRDLEDAKAWLGLPLDLGDPFADMALA